MFAYLARSLIRVAFVLALLKWILSAPPAFASGSYTTPGSRALADSNDASDTLIAGDNKILLSRTGFSAARTLIKKFTTEPSAVSGALLARKIPNDTPSVARICSQTQSVFLSLFPDGRSTFEVTDLEQILQIKGPRELRCAVNRRSGEWIAVNLRNGLGALFPASLVGQRTSRSFNLPSVGRQWTHIISMNDVFFAFAENGQSALVESSADGSANVRAIRSPYANLDPHDTLAANGSFLLKVGQTQFMLTQIQDDPHNPAWLPASKVSLSPCAETSGCGAWIAADGRWIVAGLWGTYIGSGQQFTRVNTPQVIGDATTPGIALVRQRSGDSGYVIVGDVDADIGTVPAVHMQTHPADTVATIESHGKHANRFVVWLKGRVDELAAFFPSDTEKPKPLFSYTPYSTQSSLSGDVIMVEGRLPQSLPAHWAAAEPQVEFDAIAMANEWTPARSALGLQPPKQPWWTASLMTQQAVKELNAAGVRPQPIKVAVVDSGADLQHPALQNVFQMNPDEIPDNGIDDDGNGLVDDVIGYDFVNEDSTPEDQFGHGTHVAGLLRNIWSDDGLMGGALNARLRILRALDDKGRSNSIDLARGISAAIRDQADILNCSWGGGPETQVLRDAFAAARKADILIFSSAGNDGLNTDVYPQVPKKFAGVFAIGASTAGQTRARFSNWGANSVFLFAPGADILSSLPEGRLGEKSGTSMASPIAASVASMVLGTMRSLHPEWSRSQQAESVSDVLCRSSEKNKLATSSSKCGSLNSLRAIQTALKGVP